VPVPGAVPSASARVPSARVPVPVPGDSASASARGRCPGTVPGTVAVRCPCPIVCVPVAVQWHSVAGTETDMSGRSASTGTARCSAVQGTVPGRYRDGTGTATGPAVLEGHLQ